VAAVTIKRRNLVAGAVALTAAARVPARADTFPSKPLRFIVPYVAGGNVDVTVRLVGEAMQRMLGQTVVVDNRPGAGGLVGQDAMIAAPADGYTLCSSGFSSLYVSALMAGRPSMVPLVQPISTLTTVPMVVVVPGNSKYADWKALLADAKANPDTVSLGHAGNGTTNHIVILRLQRTSSVRFAVVPYRGSGAGINDAMAGQISGYVDQITSSLPYIRSGKLRALLTVGESRAPDLPDVPSLGDLGEPVFDGGTTIGVFVRKETPPELVKTLNTAVVAALKEPAVTKRLVELGAVVRPSTPEGFAAAMKSDERALGELERAGLLKAE
jgi:tripartite-type tricarboxylate transporter receptor subunit TctC